MPCCSRRSPTARCSWSTPEGPTEAPVQRGREALAQAGARVLGVVLNRVPERSSGRYQYDYYGAYGVDHGGQGGARATTPADQA